MKKVIITILGVILLTSVVQAQSPLDKGGVQLNAGVGFSGWGIPVYLGMDYGIHEDITLGAELSYRRYHNNVIGIEFNHTVIGFLVNGNYHFNTLLELPDPWDLYAGLNVGFYSWSSPDNFKGTSGSGIGLGIQIGGRYYISEKVGFNLEFGGGNSVSGAKVGVTFKF